MKISNSESEIRSKFKEITDNVSDIIIKNNIDVSSFIISISSPLKQGTLCSLIKLSEKNINPKFSECINKFIGDGSEIDVNLIRFKIYVYSNKNLEICINTVYQI